MPISSRFYRLFLFTFLRLFIVNVSDDSPGSFSPTDNILLNCGSSGNSASQDGQQWTGHVNSEFISISMSNDAESCNKTNLSISNDPVPYESVRFFHFQLTYSFYVSSGQKFVRLYFNPNLARASFSTKVLFSVTISSFILLSNFSPSISADPFVKEFCLNVKDHEVLSLTFTPGYSDSSYGFIDGIKIVSMPDNLYYTASGDMGMEFVSQGVRSFLQNNSALEMVYRLNVGGNSILPVDDSGMFRRWTEDGSFVFNSSSSYTNRTSRFNFRNVTYSAPTEVYQSFRFTSKGTNLTWNLPVDAGLKYMVRLHFCELKQSTKWGDRKFQIIVADQIAETSADTTNWAGGNGIPVFRDYAVMIPSDRTVMRRNLSVILQPKGESSPILNGLEIFKIINSSGNLDDHDSEESVTARILPEIPDNRREQSRKWKTLIFDLSEGISVLIVVFFIGFIIFWCCRRVRTREEITKPQPEVPCRRFTAEDIQNATNNFDRNLVIGNGGFGRVFKGYIDNGNTPVAIKALKPTSSQGSREFWAEIEMLSRLRHDHLVSLIGYCNDQHLMTLVYDYMANGSLCNHLYHTKKPPLPWKQRLEIFIGAARGIKYLHTGTDHCIIHRDIKSSNILLDQNWVPKVSDFGLSRLGPASMSSSHVTTDVKGTFGYLDPEYFSTNHLCVKSDVFSFGLLLFEVLCARPAVDRQLDEEQHSLAQWATKHCKEGTLDQIIDPNLTGEIAPESLKIYAKIAMKCVRHRKNERPTMWNVLKKLELALKMQESFDIAAEEEIINSESDTEEMSLRQSGNTSGCLVQSCIFWPKNSAANKESYKFYSERAIVNNKMIKKPPSLRKLRGILYTIFALKSLRKDQKRSSDSSSSAPDLSSEEMLIEITDVSIKE